MSLSSQWEQLAGEAIADAAGWKAEARKAQAQRDELLAALRTLEQLVTAHVGEEADNWCRDARAAIERAEVQS